MIYDFTIYDLRLEFDCKYITEGKNPHKQGDRGRFTLTNI